MTSTLTKDLEELLKSQQLVDISLLTNDKQKLDAHRAVIGTRCGVLSLQMLPLLSTKKGGKDSSGLLELQVDFSKLVGEKILHFLYTDDVDVSTLPRDDLFKLAVAAKKLDLERLFVFCERFMASNLSLETIVPTMLSAVKNEWKLVERYCYDFILKNYVGVVSLPNFSTLGPQLLVEVIKLQQANPNGIQVPAMSDLPASTLVEDLNTLFTEKDFTDFSVTTKEQNFKIHLFPLIARCGNIRKTMPKTIGELQNRNLSVALANGTQPLPSSLEAFLKYLYTDAIEMSVEDAVYCVALADLYQLSSSQLKDGCLKIIDEKLDTKNVLAALDAADRCVNQELKTKFIEKIVSSYSQVVQSNDLKKVRKALLIDILQALAKK